MWTEHILFLHSSVDGHLDSLYLLASVNNAAGTFVYKFLMWTRVFVSLGCHRVTLFYLLMNYQSASHTVTPFSILATIDERDSYCFFLPLVDNLLLNDSTQKSAHIISVQRDEFSYPGHAHLISSRNRILLPSQEMPHALSYSPISCPPPENHHPDSNSIG